MSDDKKGIDYYESFSEIKIPDKASPIKPFEELEDITTAVINYLLNEKLLHPGDLATVASGLLSFCIINSDADLNAVRSLVDKSVNRAAGLRSHIEGTS